MSTGFPNPPGVLDTPEFKDWITQVVQRLFEHADTKAQAVRDELIEAIKEQGATKSPDQPSPHVVLDPLPSKSTRQQLPHPEPFDGKDKSLFEPWKTSVVAKVKIEGHLIGDHVAQFYYVHSRLRDKALQMASPYINQCVSLLTYDPHDLIRYLSTIYDDPNRAERALRTLHSLQQSEKAVFAHFLPVFEKSLSEAGGLQWPDNVKINHLYNALSKGLKRTLIPVQLPSTYFDYVRRVQELAARYESLDKPSSNSTNSNHRGQDKAAVEEDSMDWEPVTAQSAALEKANKALKGKRAKWVSQDEIQKRKKEGRCMRCGRRECRIPKCPLSPAKPPGKQVQVKAASVKALVRSAEVESEESDSESEK